MPYTVLSAPMVNLTRLLGASVALLLFATGASAKLTETISKSYAFDAKGVIHLENVNGAVEIIAWDKAEVTLEAEKSAQDQEGLDRLHIKIEATEHRLSIKTEIEKKWRFWGNTSGQVRYKLMVPAGASLDGIEVVNANVHVTGLQGAVALEAVNGSIEATALAGPGRFESVNGSIRVTYATMPAVDTRISLETVNGSCQLRLPADAAFDLSAETVNGRITCDFPITLSESGKHELHGAVNGGGPRVSLESVNGGLTVKRAD